METVRVVCAHDCPDMCSLLAEVEDGRVLRIKGDPEQPFTAGFACAKVNRDAELVHSPARLQTPLRRIGAKGESKFAPIGWDEALDEITGRWRAIIAESGPLALLGYAYSAHQGQLNRGLMLGLFHALGTEGAGFCLKMLGKDDTPAAEAPPDSVRRLMQLGTLYRFQAIVEGMAANAKPVEPLSKEETRVFEASLAREGVNFKDVNTGAYLKTSLEPGKPCLTLETLHLAIARLPEGMRRKMYTGMFFAGRDK